MASHIGSLAGGFATGFLNAYNAQIRAQYTRMLTEHYRYVMLAAGYNPQNHMFWDTDGSHGGNWTSPYQQPLPGTRDAYTQGWLKAHPNEGTMPPVSGGGGGGSSGGGARAMNFENADKVFSYLTSQGVKPVVAQGFVGSMAHESGGFQNDAYNPDDNGSPSGGWGQWHKDRFADFTGRFGSDRSKWTADDNMAMFKHEMEDTDVGKRTIEALKKGSSLEDGLNTSIDVYEGASRDPATLNMNSRNSYAIDFGGHLQEKEAPPATASAAPSTGPKAGQMSPAGGPYVQHDGQLYETNADGKINPTPVANQPAAAATTQAAQIAAPAGGGFALPGSGKGIPTPDDLIDLSSPQSDPNKASQGYQTGNARSPTARDPYWRANPPMAPLQQPKKAEQPQKSPVTAPLPPPRPVVGTPAQPMMPPRTSTPDSAGPEYVPGTPPRPPHTPTPATAYPQPVAASPAAAPPPQVAAALAKEAVPQLPPEEPPQPVDSGGGGVSMPTTEPLPQQIPFVDPWVDFQQQNPYQQPITFASRKGGPIGYDDGGTIDSSDSGDVRSPSQINAPAAYRAFTDPDSPSGPTAANMETQLRNAGTALALPVITRDLLRNLYTNPQQLQPRTGVPAPPPQPAPQPMNTAKQFPSPDEYNGAPTPVWKGSPMGAVGTAIQPYSPTIGNAIVGAGNMIDNWVDAHMPANDRLKAQQDEQNNFNDEMREQHTQLERLYHPREEEFGSPIQRYARGGMVVKLQGGGNPGSFGSNNSWNGLGPNYGNSSPDAIPANWYNQPAYMNTPAAADRTALQKQMSDMLYPGGNAPVNLFSQGAHYSTPTELSAWNNLTPDQQTWYSNTSGDIASMGTQPLALQDLVYKSDTSGAPKAAAPAAATPTATPAPAAPPPRLMTQFTPPQDVVTPATTAVNVASGTPTTTNATPTFGSGANTANANSIQSATNYTHYDDGGEVGMQGPSTVGPPPGLSGGGQPVPPMYYNPGTYSQAGAPVGKGVTQNSLPAIYPAAPVPTYKRGGAVMRYDDGGDVGGPEEDDTVPVPASDTAGPAPNEADMPSPVAQPVSFSGAGRTPTYARMPTVTAPGLRMPRASGGGGGATRGRAPQATGSSMNPDETDPSGWYDKPDGMPAAAPMIQDHQGNPSPGVTGALAAGMHFIGQFMELGPWSQGVPSPQAQQERQAFASGQGAPSDAQVKKVMDTADPNHELGEMQRFMGALEMLYKYDILQGNPEQAQRDAACMLMYGREAAARYGKEAIKHYYKGDVQGALDSLQDANNYTVDGSNWHATMNKDGTVHAEKRNLNNSVLEWEANVAPQEILAAALKVANGQAYWQMLEQAAYKYDPIAKAMVDQRSGLETERQIAAAGPAYAPTPSPNGPAPGGPGGPAGPQAPQSPQAPSGPQQTPATYEPSAMGGTPTTNSSPVPTPGGLPPTMVGPASAAQRMSAPTGIGAQPGQPPATRADIQGGLQPQVADAGPGPGAMPSYNPSFDTTGAGAIPPPPPASAQSPVPTRPDTTTAQGATPPPTSDERVQPAAQVNPLLQRDNVSNPNVAPMDEGGFAHVADQIHQQLFTPGSSPYFLGNGGYRVNGEDYFPPQKQDLSGVTNPAALKQLKTNEAEADKLYQQARQAAFALAKDDEAKKVADLRNTLNVTKDIYNRTQIAKGQAISEANKQQDAATAEYNKTAAARMKPYAEVFRDNTGMERPVTQLSRPAALAAFGSTSDKDDAPLHAYLPSQESTQSVVDATASVWRYNQNQTMSMAHAANLVKRLVADPMFGKTTDKDGKQIDDPNAATVLQVPGDPGDKRVWVTINDPRGGQQSFALPLASYKDIMLARNEYKQNSEADNHQKDLRLEIEKSQGAARDKLLQSVEGTAHDIILGQPGSGPTPLGPLNRPATTDGSGSAVHSLLPRPPITRGIPMPGGQP